MRKISLFKLIKKYKSYCHVSIFLNNRLDKRVKYGYRFYQKGFKDAKRLKFLKVNVREPRLPTKRKTKYGQILEARQKLIYATDFGRLHKMKIYVAGVHKGARSSPLTNFYNFNYANPLFAYYALGLLENPAFSKYFSRYYNISQSASVSRQAFRYKTSFFFSSFPVCWLYNLTIFRLRALKRLCFFYFNSRNYFFNLLTFGSYPFYSSGYFNLDKNLYGNRNSGPKVFRRVF